MKLPQIDKAADCSGNDERFQAKNWKSLSKKELQKLTSQERSRYFAVSHSLLLWSYHSRIVETGFYKWSTKQYPLSVIQYRHQLCEMKFYNCQLFTLVQPTPLPPSVYMFLCTTHLNLTPGMAGTFTQCECESQWSFWTPGQKYWVKSLPLGTQLYKPKPPV